MTENRQAVFDWIESERPDMMNDLDEIINSPYTPAPLKDAVNFVSAVAFEAGRFFQHVNPTCGLGVVMDRADGGEWNRIIDAIKAYRSGNVLP